MSTKGGFWEDTFEQLVELGASTTKKTAQAVAHNFSPLTIIEKIINPQSSSVEALPSKKNNHTPLNFEKLEKNYQKQDEQKTAILRQRLFQLVKKGEEEILMKKYQEKIVKKRQETYKEQEKKRREEERKKELTETASLPQGKIRRSIFTPLKVARRRLTEVKPAAGKQ